MRPVIALLLVAACGASSTATVVEVPPTPLPSPPPMASAARAPTAAPPRVAECFAPTDLGGCDEIARVRVGRIAMSSSTCYVDLRLTTGETGRLMRCASGAVLAFDRITYGGTWDGSALDACVVTRYRFNDGCIWQSTQRARGTSASLSIAYSEAPMSGTGCSPAACRANAELEWLGP